MSDSMISFEYGILAIIGLVLFMLLLEFAKKILLKMIHKTNHK